MTDDARTQDAPVPARGYSWPPFEEGNTAALTHGAESARLVEPRARELAPRILDAHPHLDQRKDGPAIFRLAMTYARLERVYRWLDEQDDAVFDDVDAGTTHGVLERCSRWERQASADEDRLAIAPLTRVKLGLDKLKGAQGLADFIGENGKGASQ